MLQRSKSCPSNSACVTIQHGTFRHGVNNRELSGEEVGNLGFDFDASNSRTN